MTLWFKHIDETYNIGLSDIDIGDCEIITLPTNR